MVAGSNVWWQDSKIMQCRMDGGTWYVNLLSGIQGFYHLVSIANFESFILIFRILSAS